MKDLYYYLKFANRLIQSYAKKYSVCLDISDEFISYVAERIMRGDENFNINKVPPSKRKSLNLNECRLLYMRMCGIYGIRAYLHKNRKTKKKHVLFTDLSTDKYDARQIQDLLCNNPLEILCSVDEYQEKKSLIEMLVASSGLTNNEQNIIQQKMTNKSFVQIANENGVTVQAVNSAYQNALQKMSSMINRV